MKIITNEVQLKKQNENVKIFEYKSIINKAKEMISFMYNNNGCGLAAPQVGINKNFFIARLEIGATLFLNPQILESSVETETHTEGCLSIPNTNGDVERSVWITVKFNNGTRPITATFRDFEARIIQHEFDHLNGVLFTEKATNIIPNN